MSENPQKKARAEKGGSSAAGRGGAGIYVEGELGAYYLLQMLAGSEARGLPYARIDRVQQGENEGYALDDLIVHGVSEKGTAILEIQSKRTIRFSSGDHIFKGVCEQIVRSNPAQRPTDGHLLAVATQRTSYSISGPYQDLLEWAHNAQSGVQFFARLALPGVASEDMRSFARPLGGRPDRWRQGAADRPWYRPPRHHPSPDRRRISLLCRGRVELCRAGAARPAGPDADPLHAALRNDRGRPDRARLCRQPIAPRNRALIGQIRTAAIGRKRSSGCKGRKAVTQAEEGCGYPLAQPPVLILKCKSLSK
jgi:hypothetical protein